MKRDHDAGPIGLDALGEIGKRLGDLAEHLKGAFAADGGPNDEQSGQRTFTMSTPKGPLTGVASYSLRFGSRTVDEAIAARGGAAAPRPAPAPARPAPRDEAAVREPLVDVHDEGARIVVTAELPGVQIEDVTVQIKARSLVVESHGARRFRSLVALPADVAPETLATTLRNGILQAAVDKAAAKPAP